MLRIQIIFHDPDLGSVSPCLGSVSVSYSNEHNKINRKEKFNKVPMPSGWVLLDLLTRKIKLHYLFLTERIWIHIHIQQSDSYQIEKQDPDLDRYQSEKQGLDPYQKGLDLQHWNPLTLFVRWKNCGWVLPDLDG